MSHKALLAAVLLSASVAAGPPQLRTLDDRFDPPRFSTLERWNARAAYLRDHVLASAGLMPLPARTPLNAVVFGEIRHADYSVAKVYFESLPGFFVTGNLYRPLGPGPFPAILSPHGHWTYGRLENTQAVSVPGRAIGLARQGFVVFSHDMIGYGDSRQLTHAFGGEREALWGLSLGGLQLWNSIRALDFLESLPYVRKDAIGATGESGGGTQTFLLASVDPRVAAAAPVNMISLHMQGGCVCENIPGLRLDTTNVEIAATIAPRPLLMISATGDWTAETLEREFPTVRAGYALFGAADRVRAVRIDAPHNYNKASREAMYAWMARWLQHAADEPRPEPAFSVDSAADLLVFYGRGMPEGAATAADLTARWIAAAQSQLADRDTAKNAAFANALRHALGYGDAAAAAAAPGTRSRVVIVADVRPAVVSALRAAGFDPRPVAFTPFDRAAAAKVRHFETYNRTAASLRVADIVEALRAAPSAALVAEGEAGPAALLALAIVPGRRAVIDVDRLDLRDDRAFVERLYIPGLRRAGDFQTAASLAGGSITVHNTGDRFVVSGVRVEREVLPPSAIAARLR